MSALGLRSATGRAQRTTFLLDASGHVLRVFTGVKARGHAAEVLEAARTLLAEGLGGG